MPLTTCPDCGREVSTAAPACIHCGRPLAEPASPAAYAAPDRPMAGIVTALVLGTLLIIWVLRREKASTEEMQSVNTLINTVHTLGNAALLIFALLSLQGHRAANGMVRTLSVGMVLAICGFMLVAWGVARDMLTQADAGSSRGFVGAVVVISTLMQVAPWLLYLYLFRRSRYP